MKRLFCLIGLTVLLLGTTPAHADRTNLLVNGSFENGFTGWEMHDQYSLVPGVCGAKAANLPRSFARQVGYRLRKGRTYKFSFRYKGTINVSLTNGELQTAADWTRYVRTFKAEKGQPTLWLMTFGNSGAQVDCMRLVEL